MKKLALISISLLVLIIGLGCVAAADIDGNIDGSIHVVDNQCSICEISTNQDIQNDVNIDSSVADYVNEINDSSLESIQNDLGAKGDSVKEISHNDIKGPAEIKNITNDNSTHGSAQNQTIIINNSTINTSSKTPSVNIIDDNPKEIITTAHKYKALKPDIEKYSQYYKKHAYTKNANGKIFSEMDLLLEIYKHYSFEDTVIIAMHVLRDNGVKATLLGLEGMLRGMMDGTLKTYDNEMNASYYKDEIQKIHKSHANLNDEAKKYSDIFLKKNGKKFINLPGYTYCYRDLLVEIYLNHSSIEETVLIGTYALQNAGLNVTAASIENTFNQMMKGTVKTSEGHVNKGAYYYFLNMLEQSHKIGKHNDKLQSSYYTIYAV